FLIAAGGQVAEGLRGWTLPSPGAEAAAWLASWRDDGGDARRFRAGLPGTPFAGGEGGAWRLPAQAPLLDRDGHPARQDEECRAHGEGGEAQEQGNPGLIGTGADLVI